MSYAETIATALREAGFGVAESADRAAKLPAAIILPPTTADRLGFGDSWQIEAPVQFAVPANADAAKAYVALLARVAVFADAIEKTGASLGQFDTFGAVTVAGQPGVSCTARVTLSTVTP